MARHAGAAPRNAPSAVRSRVPVYRSDAPSSMEAGDAWRIGFKGQTGPVWPENARLDMRRGNARAIALPHQHAVLGLAQIRNAHGEPYSDGRQRDGKGESRNVGQHALAKIVRLIPVSLIARQVVRLTLRVLLRLAARIPPPTRRVGQGARPEFEHAMLFFRG